MRFDRMSGLDAEQLDELEELISDLLDEPWDKGNGRLRELTLREALTVTSGYARNNITEESGLRSSTWISPRSRATSRS